MSKKKTKGTTYGKGDSSQGNRLLLAPLIMAIGIIPLIVRMKVYDAGLAEFPWASAKDEKIDFFLYYKSYLFIGVSAVVALILICSLIQGFRDSRKDNMLMENGKYKWSFSLVPLMIYGVLALLSTIFSKYPSFGFKGIYEQFESVFVLLGYCLIVYYAYLVIRSKEDVAYIMKWLLASALILCFIGLTQVIGHDFFASSFGKKFIVPSAHWNINDQLNFNFEKNRVYLTLYNPNYVGSYVALILPIFLMLSIFSKDKKMKLIYLIPILGLLIALIGSSSRAGLVGLVISILVLLILLRKKLIAHWKISLGVGAVCLVGMFSLIAIFGNNFLGRFQNILSDSKTPEYALSSIVTNDDNVEITYNKNTLYVQMDFTEENGIGLKLEDSNHTTIESNYDEESSSFLINDPRFSSMPIQIVNVNDVLGFSIQIEDSSWVFTNQTEDGTYYYLNGFGKFDKILPSESAVFTNHQLLGSGRGYIWAKTIPLLKKYIPLGSGADTYSLVFPHNDYVGRYHWGDVNSLFTKPHNMYLQIGVQTGVLSLIAYLAFYLMYFVNSIRLYMKNDFNSYLSQIGAAIFIGTIGYMITGFFNDSTITVAPIYWALIGIGLAINSKVKNETEPS